VTALAVLARVTTFPEKWCIVAGREKQAKIIMGYMIDHIFDNPYMKGKFEVSRDESEERIRRERSRTRLTFRQPDGALGEVYVLSADSRNKQTAGDSVMGFGCIQAGCKIMTNKGLLDIKDVVEKKLDVKILSYNHLKEKTEFEDILEYQKNPLVDRYMIEIDCGEKIICTNDHPVFIKNKGYIRADEVVEGDVVIRIDKSKS